MEIKKRRRRVRFDVPITATLMQFTNDDGSPDMTPEATRKRVLRIYVNPGLPFEMPDEVIVHWNRNQDEGVHALLYNLDHWDPKGEVRVPVRRREIV